VTAGDALRIVVADGEFSGVVTGPRQWTIQPDCGFDVHALGAQPWI